MGIKLTESMGENNKPIFPGDRRWNMNAGESGTNTSVVRFGIGTQYDK